MEVTRRFWGLAGTGGTLMTLAVVFARPMLLYPGAAIGALLLARQYRFYRALRATDLTLAVDQSLPAQYVTKDDETQVTLAARLAQPSALSLTIDASPPLIATASTRDGQRITLDPGDTEETTAFELEWPVVGRGTFDEPTVTAADPHGLFRETLPRGPQPEVVVEPRTPRNIHVGEGGDQIVASYGGHRSDQLGSGTDPAEIRQYVPGDSVSDIDWKATARLDYPHVREYEVETDRQSVLVLDHRSHLQAGRVGETPFDYLRELALSFVGNAEQLTDPLGLAVVGEAGTAAWERPATSPDTYETVRSTLQDLPVEADAGQAPHAVTGVHGHGAGRARRKAAHLAGDETEYGQTLQPFFAEASGYVQRMDSDPLFGTVRTSLEKVRGATWAVILTDDSDRTQLRETVKLARQQAAGVAVFIAPTALFERGGLADLDAAYQQYVDFEDFRRELARLDGVSAFEVGPGDRVEAVLSAGRSRRG